MSTLKNIGIPGVGVGVLHPKLKNRFRVLFSARDGTSLGEWSRDLSMQVVAVSEIMQLRGRQEGPSA